MLRVYGCLCASVSLRATRQKADHCMRLCVFQYAQRFRLYQTFYTRKFSQSDQFVKSLWKWQYNIIAKQEWNLLSQQRGKATTIQQGKINSCSNCSWGQCAAATGKYHKVNQNKNPYWHLLPDTDRGRTRWSAAAEINSIFDSMFAKTNGSGRAKNQLNFSCGLDNFVWSELVHSYSFTPCVLVCVFFSSFHLWFERIEFRRRTNSESKMCWLPLLSRFFSFSFSVLSVLFVMPFSRARSIRMIFFWRFFRNWLFMRREGERGNECEIKSIVSIRTFEICKFDIDDDDDDETTTTSTTTTTTQYKRTSAAHTLSNQENAHMLRHTALNRHCCGRMSENVPRIYGVMCTV